KGLTSLVDSLTRELIQENRERTARAYRTAWRRLLLYYGKKDLSSRDFSDGFIKGFERLLQAEKCSLNTISFYMRNLRAIYNKGKEKGFFHRTYLILSGMFIRKLHQPANAL
ncbi:MAG: phage integrase SAM-like domain-containing protein, partial [Tannerellaceae bacterium]|nr:phage integrase SAM-like domain-containing protein [Tannerellaceae bacterium]